ncbi:MAG: NAD(P)-binding domain-containing protein [Myxococcota bacterium]
MITHDTIVLGGGAAGLQLGYFLGAAGRDFCILERGRDVGSFWDRLPRNGKLISFNKVHSIYDDPEMLLRWDWNSLLTDYQHNFRDYSQRLYPRASEMKAYLKAFAERFPAPIHFDTAVRRIHRSGSGFELDAGSTRFACRRLVVATGLSRPYVPDIDGLEFVEDGYENVDFDPASFEGQRVLILGKGNSAFELADAVVGTTALLHLASPNPLRFAWETRHPGHVRADYTRLLDTYQLKLLNSVLDCEILRIRPEAGGFRVRMRYTHAEGEVDELFYDRVVRCTGFAFDDSVFSPECRPDMILEGRLPKQTEGWESTNVPNLFFAGTLMQARDFKRASSAFVDGFRYNVRTLFHMLEARYEGVPLPAASLPEDLDGLADALLHRICRTSGLWAQFGYLADVVVWGPDGVRHLEELPVDWVHASDLAQAPRMVLITFEWGPADGDVFALARRPRADAADQSAFLHPVLRCYRYGVLTEEHHVLEDLFGMYAAEGEVDPHCSHNGLDVAAYHARQHVDPLRRFLGHVLDPATEVAQ